MSNIIGIHWLEGKGAKEGTCIPTKNNMNYNLLHFLINRINILMHETKKYTVLLLIYFILFLLKFMK